DAPAYPRLRVAPVPGGGLARARARLESPYGPIESE
ncbi:alpha-L-rhamnosidase C-terminal domain-containing protein, partial [uncultured Phenylobacterium sp.]